MFIYILIGSILFLISTFLALQFIKETIYYKPSSTIIPIKELKKIIKQESLPFYIKELNITGYKSSIYSIIFLNKKRTNKLVIFSHSTYESMYSKLYLIHLFSKSKINVLFYDYPSYGRSEGSLGEYYLENTLETIIRHLNENYNVTNNDIILISEELMAAINLKIGIMFDIKNMILINPFIDVPSTIDNIKELEPMFIEIGKYICKNDYNTNKYLDKYEYPIIYVYDKEHKIVKKENIDKMLREKDKLIECKFDSTIIKKIPILNI